MNNKDPAANRLTVFDWIGIVYVVSNIAVLFLFPKIAAAFREMYRDFGGELPLLTSIVLQPWFSILFAVAGSAVFSLQWRTGIRESLKRKRAVIVISFVLVTTASAICFIGLNLPIFDMAETLSP